MNVKLRKAREAAGLTQAQLAEEAGVSEVVYQRYEYNVNRPGVDAAIRIARVLCVTVEELFGQ